MGDVTTQALACQDCDVQIFRKSRSGPIPTRCAACARARQKAQTTANDKRRRAAASKIEPTFTCQECMQTFKRPALIGPAQKRCEPCKAVWTKEQGRRGGQRAKARKAALFAADGRPSTCETCGSEITGARMGPKARHCRPCFLKIRSGREYTPIVPTAIVCPDCGVEVKRVARGLTRKRCAKCAPRHNAEAWAKANPEKRRELARRARHKRRARIVKAGFERFSDLEIFVRDKWKCGVCQKRINKKLRHPHPKSASLDHVIPVSQGGPHTRANTRAAHLDCNVKRQAKGGGEQLALVG